MRTPGRLHTEARAALEARGCRYEVVSGDWPERCRRAEEIVRGALAEVRQ